MNPDDFRRRSDQTLAQISGSTARDIYRKILSTLDVDALCLAARTNGAIFGGSGPEKYFDPDHFRSKIGIALDLRLHESQPKKILDVGAGPGHFLAVCKALGHSVIAADVDYPPRYNAIYSSLCGIFEIERRICRVVRLQKIPIEGTFDLVSTQGPVFDRVYTPDIGPETDWATYSAALTTVSYWSVSDWMFFVRDVGHRLLGEGGQLHIAINPPPVPSEDFLTKCETLGASVNRQRRSVVMTTDQARLNGIR